MKAKLLFVTLLIFLASISIASALDMPPIATIIATPGTNVTQTVTITIQATDVMDNAGLTRLELYKDNVLNATRDCAGATTCTLTQTFVSAYLLNMTFYGIAYDRGAQNTTTNTINVTFTGANWPPDIAGLPDRSINEDSGNNANLTDLHQYATDNWTQPQNLIYTIINQTNTTVANCVITANQWIDCTTPTLDAFGTTDITVQASDGQLADNDTFTLTVVPVNDAPVLNGTIPDMTFAEDTNYTFNISDYFSDVDNLMSQLTYSNSNISNLTVNYGAYNTTTNKTEALLVPAHDFNGVLYTTFTANDGTNSSNASNNITITITPVNDAPGFIGTPPVGAFKDVAFSYQFNASDVDAGDVLSFYDNTTLFDIGPSTGWVNFTTNATANYTILITVCDNSGAADNCTNSTWDFRIYEYPPIYFSQFSENPASPAGYQSNINYTFSVRAQPVVREDIPLTQNATVDTVLLEFNGTNHTAANTTNTFYEANLTSLAVGNYTYRWHANYTNGLAYSTNLTNYTVTIGDPGLAIIGPTTYDYNSTMPVNMSCSANTTQVTPILTRSGVGAVSNPDTSILAAGNYTYWCTSAATQNYTAGNVSKNLTVNPATVAVSLNVQTPITYNASANVTCSATPAGITPTLERNGTALPGLNDTSILAAGTYNYTCYYNATQNYTGDSKTAMLTVNKATPTLNLTMWGQPGDYYIPANSSLPVPVLIAGLLITPSPPGYTELYINNTFNNSGNNTGVSAWYNAVASVPVTFVYNATQNYSQQSITNWIYIGTPIIKSNITPASGSSFNSTSFTLSFTTNNATSCNWSLNPASINTPFTTTGGTSHSTSITGLVLGANNVYVQCTNETTATNLSYTVQNIFTGTTALINGATANNSILASTQVSNSTLQSVNASNSVINGSILTGCTVINSTVKNYQGTNCTIINSFVDPPSPGNDLTGSTITGNSTVMNSNVTYSTVDDSNVEDSNVNASNIIDNSMVLRSTISYCTADSAYFFDSTCRVNSLINDSTVTDGSIIQNSTIGPNSVVMNSTVTNSTALGSVVRNSTVINSYFNIAEVYNATVTNANITNRIIYSGVIQQAGMAPYNATASGPANVSDLINLPPQPTFSWSPRPATVGQTITFNAANSTDQNIGGPLNDSIVSYFWDFNDGTNATGVTTTKKYNTAGNKYAKLTVTDSYGVSSSTYTWAVQVITTGGGGGGGGSGGGGGGGGGGYASPYGREWTLDLDKRSLEIIIFNAKDTAKITYQNKSNSMAITGIDRQTVNFTINNAPYAMANQEIKKIDMDNDGVYDVRVLIMANYFTRAQIRFDRWNEPVQGYVPPLLFNFPETPVEEEPPVVIPPAEEQPPAEETPVEEPPAETPPATETEEETEGGFFSNLLGKLPQDSKFVGAAITVGVVAVGLLIYFLVSLILL